MKALTRLIALLAVPALVAWGCGGGGNGDEDTATDEGPDTADVVEDTPVDTTTDPVEDPTGDPTGDPTEEEPSSGPCGNGTLDSGEVCDDGNTATEWCDLTTEGACLSDCSLLNAECGDGEPDEGEACDDGDDDSFDECTTSCTTNDTTFGAPCRCTGSDCTGLDFTAGTIEGCDALAALADSTRSLACVRSAVETVAGTTVTVYGANGACGLMAMGCEGSGMLCGFVPTTGDVDAITCPAGSAMMTDVRTEMGGMITVTTKACTQTCTTQADCRWNAVEPSGSPFEGDCGRWTCLPDGDGGATICVDPRNTE
jgi:hypothetical protein